jgi:hypothetical protein
MAEGKLNCIMLIIRKPIRYPDLLYDLFSFHFNASQKKPAGGRRVCNGDHLKEPIWMAGASQTMFQKVLTELGRKR